jgi:hypothetical protein
MARVKPQHSVMRSHAGDVWAAKASAVHGGRVPMSLRQRYIKRHGLPEDEDVGYDPG